MGWTKRLFGVNLFPAHTPHGASAGTLVDATWAALSALMWVEIWTGLFLALHYVPSTHDAWSSVWFLQERVPGGWLVRGLHHHAANLAMGVATLHLAAMVWVHSYARSRKLLWWLALVAVTLILGATISGLRLPWDQQAYWALLVELNIAESMPVVGSWLKEIIQGGSRLGQAALGRLWMVHAFVVPLLWWGLTRLRNRVLLATDPDGSPSTRVDVGGSARPTVAASVVDGAAVMAALTLTAVLASLFHAPLDAPAEAGRDFPARPEWFILPLYQLRMLAGAERELLATAVAPAVLGGLLFLWPLLDHRYGSWVRRGVWLLPLALVGLSLAWLSLGAKAHDASDQKFQRAVSRAEQHAARAKELARTGIPPQGPIHMLTHDPMTRGRDVYAQYCTSCHVLNGEGKRKAPDHTGYASKEWIRKLLLDPQSDHFFGQAGLSEEMPAQDDLDDAQITEVVNFVFAQGDPNADHTAGFELFEAECMTCHRYGEDGDLLGLGGPNLKGFASVQWNRGQIMDPNSENQYGDLNEMPAFADQLDRHDTDMVAKFLHAQRTQQPDW